MNILSHAETTFNDLDVLSAGPVTADISKSFDKYWNSEEAFPIAALHRPPSDVHYVSEVKRLLKENWDETLVPERGRSMLDNTLPKRFKNAELKLIWAKAELAVDDPKKVSQDTEDAVSKPPQLD